jgi:hypothetical protein
MAKACERVIGRHKNATSGSPEFRLYSVAYAFAQLQEKRQRADYDLSATLSATDVELAVGLAFDAFECWKTIKNEQIAQDYLFPCSSMAGHDTRLKRAIAGAVPTDRLRSPRNRSTRTTTKVAAFYA